MELKPVTFEISPTLAHYVSFSGQESVVPGEPGYYFVHEGEAIGPYDTMRQAVSAAYKTITFSSVA